VRKRTKKPPAFPKQRFRPVTEAFTIASRAFFAKVSREMDPFVGGIRHVEVPEGSVIVQQTSHGPRTLEMPELRTRVAFEGRVVRETRVDEFVEALFQSAQDMTRQRAALVFKRLNEIIDEAGRSVSAAQLDFETYIAALENTEVEFAPDGRPRHTLVASPEIGRRVGEWERDQEKMDRRKEVVRRKYEQWLDRERTRKLVE
jgi:hypothetical protein